MITITFFAKEIEKKDKVNLETITGFRTEGHAEYAEYGQDIVCAAVSILVMNTMESIRLLSSDVFDYEEDEDNDIIYDEGEDIYLKPLKDSVVVIKGK